MHMTIGYFRAAKHYERAVNIRPVNSNYSEMK